jgi:hypothetical protein
LRREFISLHTTIECELPSEENPSEATLHLDSLCHEITSESGKVIKIVILAYCLPNAFFNFNSIITRERD